MYPSTIFESEKNAIEFRVMSSSRWVFCIASASCTDAHNSKRGILVAAEAARRLCAKTRAVLVVQSSMIW